MSTGNVPGASSIGNADGAARDFARTGANPPTSNHTTRGPIGAPGANGEADFHPDPSRPAGSVAEPGFLTANGSRDSHAVILADCTRNGSPRAGRPYGRISWAGIRELVERPRAVEKDSAPLVILSTYAEHDGRTHEVQRARGVFGGLAVDIDKGDPSLEDVVAAVRAVAGNVEAEVYSSSSASPDARKWRVLFPLARPIAGADYADTQLALFALFAERGIVCDPTLSRGAQPVYLPNVPPKRRGPDGRPLFYVGRHLEGRRLDLVPGSPIVEARDTLRRRRAAEEAEQSRRSAEAAAKRAAYAAETGDDFDPIAHFNANHRVCDLLARYGFKRRERGKGSHWSSPLSSSGSYSTEDRGDHWVCVSAWAREHNVGRESRNGHRYGSAFDLFAHFEHRGDRSAAVRTYADQVRPRRHGGKLARSPAVRVEPAEQLVEELVDLEQYRRDIAQAVAGAVLDNRPGFKLLRGDPGTGKTYAVARAVARYPRGVVAVPGHELAAEVVELLRDEGADAAAYPRLDESTCANYETAARAQRAGLSAPATVCPKCPLLRQCRESGYLAGVKAAEGAAHKVVTHARLARSAPRLLKKADYVVIEEDPSAVLAPMVSTTRRALERLADLGEAYADALSRTWILDGAPDLVPVEPVSDFDAWALEEREDVADVAGVAGESCIRIQHSATGSESSNTVSLDLTPSRRSFPRGFFGQVCKVADKLATAATRALAGDIGDGVHELGAHAVSDVPKNPELAVWDALETIDRVDPDAVAGIPPEALQLALAVATGRAVRVFLQVETDTRPNGRRSVELVAQWRVGVHSWRVPVFVNDGTLDADILERLAGGEVEDITPTGRVPLAHFAAQYPVDILPSTSTAKVAEILTGIAREHAELERLGVLLHQRHYRELLEADDSPLPSDVRSRIVWATYFGSGSDRGTNGLHRLADLCVLIGTHRPPPAEIRRTLVRWGELEAAAMSPTWGRIDRQGAGPGGELVPYHGRGYAETQWARAADAVIRATVRQGSARSRAIAADGCAVVAVTTEATGLPVLPAEALPVADLRLDELVAAVAGAVADGVKMGNPESCHGAEYRAKNPISLSRENGAILPGSWVTLEDVEKRLPGTPRRTVLRWMADAVEAGLVLRSGAARATRYALPGTAPAVAAVDTSSRTPGRKVATPAPAPLVVVTLEPAQLPAVVEPVLQAPTPRPTPPPPVVAETPPPDDWLEHVLAPDRHADERLALECYFAGPHARDIGFPAAWAVETPPLVSKLVRFARLEAKRQGKPPPSVDVVARHTVAWYAQTIAAVAG